MRHDPVPAHPQITVFSAFLTMDANRQKAGRMDYCCCFTNRKHLEVCAYVGGSPG